MSHGAMGSARSYHWIGEALAQAGYLVAGVSHYGESMVYGAESVDPSAVLRHWERPLDITAALTLILQQGRYRDHIDVTRGIGFVGHSSGGATAMQLAGAHLNDDLMTDYCASEAAAQDRGCDYGDSADQAPPTVIEPPRQDFSDARLRAFVALDPALGPAFADFSEIAPATRMLIVGSVQNDFLPFKHHAGRLSERFPNARHHRLDQGEGHFIYLSECALYITVNGVPLCHDRAGVSRSAVHRKLAPLMVEFFNQHLQAPTETNSARWPRR